MSNLISSQSRKFHHRYIYWWIFGGASYTYLAIWYFTELFKQTEYITIIIYSFGIVFYSFSTFYFWYMAAYNCINISQDGFNIRGFGLNVITAWENVEIIGPVEIRGKKYPLGLVLREPVVKPIVGKRKFFTPDYIGEDKIGLSDFVSEKRWKELEQTIQLYRHETVQS